MESTQSIKRRIKAVTNTSQITRAMEMVAANKMRKAQLVTLNSRSYALAGLNLLKELTRRIPHIPMLMRPVRGMKSGDFSLRSGTSNGMRTPENPGKTLVVLMTADKGLAGSFNSSVFRKFEREIQNKENNVYAAVGKKAEEYITRKKLPLKKSFIKFGDYAKPEETHDLAQFIINGFLEKKWSGVITISTHFKTTLRQDVLVRNLLPVSYESLLKDIEEIIPEHGRYADTKKSAEQTQNDYEYVVEPRNSGAAEMMIGHLVEHLVQMVVYHLVLESNASEHSSRMVAMKNASDNAKELEDDLSLVYNKSRQAAITQEIAEITAGATAE